MKKLLLLFSLSLTLSAKGQTLVDTNKIWTITYCISNGGCPTYIYKFNGDTIIGSHQYKKLNASYDSTMSQWYYQEAMREDSTKKIFRVQYGDTTEDIYYDFALNKNDTFKTCFMSFPMHLDSIDTVQLLNGEKRKRFLFDLNMPNEIWIEGIGSLSGLINVGYQYCSVDIVDFLNCFTEDNILKYKDPISNTCYFVVSVGESEKNISITLSPNPFHATATLSILDSRFTKGDLKIYDVMGQLVQQQIISNQSTKINRNGLCDGLYFYQLSNSEGLMLTGKFVVD